MRINQPFDGRFEIGSVDAWLYMEFVWNLKMWFFFLFVFSFYNNARCVVKSSARRKAPKNHNSDLFMDTCVRYGSVCWWKVNNRQTLMSSCHKLCSRRGEGGAEMIIKNDQAERNKNVSFNIRRQVAQNVIDATHKWISFYHNVIIHNISADKQCSTRIKYYVESNLYF